MARGDIAVNRAEKLRYFAFNHFARKGEYERYYALVNESFGPITESEWRPYEEQPAVIE